jgi:hypothetical protein
MVGGGGPYLGAGLARAFRGGRSDGGNEVDTSSSRLGGGAVQGIAIHFYPVVGLLCRVMGSRKRC